MFWMKVFIAHSYIARQILPWHRGIRNLYFSTFPDGAVLENYEKNMGYFGFWRGVWPISCLWVGFRSISCNNWLDPVGRWTLSPIMIIVPGIFRRSIVKRQVSTLPTDLCWLSIKQMCRVPRHTRPKRVLQFLYLSFLKQFLSMYPDRLITLNRQSASN